MIFYKKIIQGLGRVRTLQQKKTSTNKLPMYQFFSNKFPQYFEKYAAEKIIPIRQSQYQ